jgi:hypothetical protein
MNLRAAMCATFLFAVPASANRASEDAALARARTGYLNSRSMEADAIAVARGRVIRSHAVLTLALAERKPLRLINTKRACSDSDPQFDASGCTRYELVAALPTRRAYLVAKGGYEGCADLLLIDDRSGRQSALAEVPVFSPDGERLLIQNECEADRSASDNHLEIWRRQRDGWVLEWAYTDQQAYAADKSLQNIFLSNVVSWQDDRITMTFIDRTHDKVPERRWPGTLSRVHGRWVLNAGMLRSP